MKIVTLLFFCMAWFSCSNGVGPYTHQVSVHQGHTNVDPFYIPPGSKIYIHKVINLRVVKGQFVYGTLFPVAENYSPKDENKPYGNAVVIVGQHVYHARLQPGRKYSHIYENDYGPYNHNNLPEYHAWIMRPPYRGLHAELFTSHPLDNLHGYPHVHYELAPNMNFIGEFAHLPFDDLAMKKNRKNRVMKQPGIPSKL